MDSIIKTKGYDIGDVNSRFSQNLGDRTLLRNFFPRYDIDPLSPFADYIQLRLSEQSFADELRVYMRKAIRPGKDPSGVVIAEIEQQRSILDTVRAARKDIGTDIFGEEEQQYALRTYQTLKRGMSLTSASPRQREERLTNLNALIEDIKTKFPDCMQ